MQLDQTLNHVLKCNVCVRELLDAVYELYTAGLTEWM